MDAMRVFTYCWPSAIQNLICLSQGWWFAKYQFTDIRSHLCVWLTVALFYFLSDTVARFITAAADDAQPFFPPESLVSTPIPPLCDVSPAMRECVLYSTTFAKPISPRN